MPENIEKNAPREIEEAFREGEYRRVLDISDSAKDKRFINRDWEIIHRFAGTAAFVLAGGLASQNKEMLDRAKQEAEDAMSYGASSDLVPESNYCFTLALFSQILYPLFGKETAFNFISKARGMYPESSDLVAANAALCIQTREYENGANNATLAIALADKEERPRVKAMAQYYLSLAYKGLGRNDEAEKQMAIAQNMMEDEQDALGDNSPVAVARCISIARNEIKNLAQGGRTAEKIKPRP